MAERHHVVVDGSNLATEGRTLPSLAQLDAAVRAYMAEDPDAEIVVVVDASFEHRIDASERDQLEQAELHGEIVSPPAGAVGRGDAFVLRIAERTNALVLSNDSFQEFHGEHPWLFEAGRLVGGKPVPGVGWIFTPRVPVRGAKSREATTRASRDARVAAVPAPVKAAEVAKAAKKVAKAARAAQKAARHPDGSVPRIGDVWGEQPGGPGTAPDEGSVAPGARRPSGEAEARPAKAAAAPAKRTAKETAKKAASARTPAAPDGAEVPAAAEAPAKTAKKTAKRAAKKTDKSAAKVAAKSAKNAAGTKRAAKVAVPAAAAAPATRAAKKTAKKAAKKTAKDAAAEVAKTAVLVPAAEPGGAEPDARRRASVVDSRVRAAIAEAMAEAFDPPVVDGRTGSTRGRAEQKGGKSAKRRRPPALPPPAVNEPLAFIMFVASYPIGSAVEGVVASYTSHGAMVEVGLPGEGSLHCYIPLTNLSDPPPSKAREVLTRGERRRFVLVGLDPARRVAELALEPAVSPPATA
jgi:hypothetical protein